MPALPTTIITFISVFSSVFTTPTWVKIKLLLTGTILCRGPRRITSILRVMGLGDIANFGKYHRILNQAKGNSVKLSKILFGLLIAVLPTSWPILIAADETLERRKGKKIKAKGCYRDAVRSTKAIIVKCFGLKWECMMLIVPLPFCSRPWALPFMTVLAPSRKYNEAKGKRHKTSIDWTIIMMRVVCRWLQGRTWILIGDGAYACLHLAQACIKNGVALISRLRMDAQLYDFPEEATAGQRGRKRIKGKRIKLREYLNDESQDWATVEVKWYGRKKKTVTLLSKICLWYQAGKPPVKLRFVLVVDPTNDNNPEVFFSTDVNLAMTKIIEYFVLRWNIEVTFEEIREHLGMETQRQWSDKAIARTTPLLMGIYSLVILFALQLKELHNLTPLSTAWYQKNNEASFSDIIAFVRRIIWAEKYFSKSSESEDFIKIERVELNSLITQLARTG